ncbi:MAG: alpha/beta fold hydrolase [Acidobacteriota bacterium]
MTDTALLPDPDIGIRPPSFLAPWREVLTPLDWARLARDWRGLPKGRAERPRTVVLVPGFGASPLSMSFISRALKRDGHAPTDWGLGRNTGEVADLLPQLIEKVEAASERAGEEVALVGWSLGGYLAREAARDRPELVSRVITLGSPVIGGPSYTRVAPLYEARGYDLAEIRQLVCERYEVPLEIPVLAIYSKRDGIVSWKACIDEWSPDVRHLEVGATHLSMGTSPDVLTAILDELEAPRQRRL